MNIHILRTRTNLIAALVVLLICFSVFLILDAAKYRKFQLHKTPFTSSNFSAVHGESVYSYSGISFQKQSVGGGEVTVLQTGLRLPTIETITWADDRGALLRFTDGSYIGSVVEDELTARGLKWNDETRSYLWYLDFKTSRLTLVSSFEVLSQNIVYNSETKSFYYIRSNGFIVDSDGLNGIPLARFSTESLSESIILDTKTDNVGRVSSCISVKTICYTFFEKNTAVLNQVVDGKTQKLAVEGFVDIIPTSNPKYFIGLKSEELDVDDEPQLLRADTYLLDVSKNKSYKLGTKVNTTNSVIANSSSSETFYILEPSPNNEVVDTPYMTVGKNTFGNFKAKNTNFTKTKAKSESGSIVEPMSISDAGLAMYSDVEGATYLVTPQGYTYGLSKKSRDNVELKLKSCFETYTTYHDYSPELLQFKIGVVYNSEFRTSISDFSKCVTQSDPGSLTGYTFVIVGVSPTDGRLVTD